MSQFQVENVVTVALQVAIQAHKENRPVEKALAMYAYNHQPNAVAERAIRGYYASRANIKLPVAVPVIDLTKQTKEQLLVLANGKNIKVFKSWTKAKLIEALTPAYAVAA